MLKTLELFYEKLKFAAVYWVPYAGVEATGGNVFYSILITPTDGWYFSLRTLSTSSEG